MGKMLKWAGIAVALPALLLVLAGVLLYVPVVQNWAVDKAAEIASKSTGMQISVGCVRLSFPLNLSLEQVEVVQGSDTVASIGRATADVQLLPLLHNQVVVDQLEISQAVVNTLSFISDLQIKGHLGRLAVASRGIDLNRGVVDLNHASLSDADVTILLSDTAAVDTTESETPWLICADSLVVGRSRVEVHLPGDTVQVDAWLGRVKATSAALDLLAGRYTVRSFDWREGALAYNDASAAPLAEAPLLDFNHLSLSNIGLGLDSVSYCSPYLMLSVRDASMRERSGLQLSRLQGSVLMDSTTLRLPQLSLATPYSYIRARVETAFSVMDSVQPGRMDISLDASLAKQDLVHFFYGQPATLSQRWPEWPLQLKAVTRGTIDHAEVEQLEVSLPTVLHAEARGSVGRQNSTLKVQADAYDLSLLKVWVPSLGQDFVLPAGLHLGGDVLARGSVYSADLTLTDQQATAHLNGKLDSRSMDYDADASVDSFNLQRFLPSQPLTHLSACIQAHGCGTDIFSKQSFMDADLSVGRLHYDTYRFDSLQASVELKDGHAIVNLDSRNQLLNGTLTLDALLGVQDLDATIGAELNQLDLYALGLVEKPLAVGVCGHVDLSSDMKERHHVSGIFTDLYIRDSLRHYRPEDVGLLLRTDRDTTLVRMQSGNLIVKLDAKGGVQQLLDKWQALADTIGQQVQTRTIDQPQLKRQLPEMRLYATSGSENPLANMLKSAMNMNFREFRADFTTSPLTGLNGTAWLHNINLDSTLIDTVRVSIVEKAHGLSFNGQVTNRKRRASELRALAGSAPPFVFNLLFDGLLQEHGASVGVRFYDAKDSLGLRLGAQATMVDEGISFHLVPQHPTLGYKQFTLNDDNFLLLQPNMRLQAKVDLVSSDGTGIKIYSEEQDSTLLQDLTVSIHRLDLDQLTSVLPYVPRITGELDGDYHLVMDEKKQVSVATDMGVQRMTYEGSPLGNVSTELVYLQREDDTHAVEGILLLDNREVSSIRGEYRSLQTGDHLNAQLRLLHFPLDLVNGFIPEQLIGFEGFAEGDMSLVGTASNIDVDGEVYLDSAALISQPYGVRLRFDNDPVRISNGQLLLENFTMYAHNDEPLNIMGNIDFHNISRTTMDLRMRARNYQLINSRQTSKSVAWGKAFVNVFASMRGPLDHLTMRGRLDVLGTTDLNYILLDSPLSTDNRMNDLVKFTDFNDSIEVSIAKPAPDGLNADLTMSIDQGAHVRCALNVDQTNYVDLFGGGDLRMQYQGDDLSLTGRYTIGSGEMKYSLPVIPLKTFTIQEGSYVEFSGDATNPRLNLTATERTKASVGQDGGTSRSVAFDCGVAITRTLNNMGVEFIISAPEDNSIANELNSMTTEERGKIAVTMLTTGMYLSDGNTSGFSMNSALSSFLQSEINNITGNALKTLDLSIGLDNTTDASGTMRTDYSFKFAKRFWNNRLKVQIGGKVSTGQDANPQGQQKSFFDNVTMEYRLSPTSNQYVKLFYNQNVYDWLEGYTSEYGGGFIWRRRLDSFWDILRFWRKEQQPAPRVPRSSAGAGPVPVGDSIAVPARTDTIPSKAE